MKKRYAALRGTRDILPEEVTRWQFVERTTREVFSRYDFREIRTPVLEATDLFARSVGESTDIVHKEMYTLQPGSESISLRPENTASVVRAFVEHSLFRGVAAGYPARFFYIGPMFRHERPQKGRQRQFHQLGAEILGSLEPLADAETLEMLWTFLDELGIGERDLVINSLGDESSRRTFRAEFGAWLEPRVGSMCDDCARRFRENPLRVFDCKEEADQLVLGQAPTVLDFLTEEASRHFGEVQRLLDGFGIPYRVDPRLVRGLDYYSRTVFEVVSTRLGAQDSVLGGGRYDGLVEELGGPAMPAFGFAVGMERLISLLPEDRGRSHGVDLTLVCLGAEGWEAAIDLARRLRSAGARVVMPVTERPMGAQLKRATRLGARYAVFVGKDELAAGRFGFKNLETGEQVEIDEADLFARFGETS